MKPFRDRLKKFLLDGLKFSLEKITHYLQFKQEVEPRIMYCTKHYCVDLAKKEHRKQNDDVFYARQIAHYNSLVFLTSVKVLFRQIS